MPSMRSLFPFLPVPARAGPCSYSGLPQRYLPANQEMQPQSPRGGALPLSSGGIYDLTRRLQPARLHTEAFNKVILIQELVWNNWNIEHIGRHHILPREVEEVCYSNPVISRARNGTLRIIGQTYSGRLLTIFLASRDRGSYFVVTARDATEAERRRFKKE